MKSVLNAWIHRGTTGQTKPEVKRASLAMRSIDIYEDQPPGAQRAS